MQQGIVVVNSRRIHIMQQHVCYAENIRELLFLYAENGIIYFFNVVGASLFLLQFFQPAYQKPPVPQAKSAQRSPICGSIIFAIKSVTARGV